MMFVFQWTCGQSFTVQCYRRQGFSSHAQTTDGEYSCFRRIQFNAVFLTAISYMLLL